MSGSVKVEQIANGVWDSLLAQHFFAAAIRDAVRGQPNLRKMWQKLAQQSSAGSKSRSAT